MDEEWAEVNRDYGNHYPLIFGKDTNYSEAKNTFTTTTHQMSVLSPMKRFSPELYDLESLDLGSDKKKAKQERNRISARECRERRKTHIKTMENQIKTLKQELLECKKELSQYKMNKEKEEVGLEILNGVEELLGSDISAKKNNKTALQNYIVYLENNVIDTMSTEREEA